MDAEVKTRRARKIIRKARSVVIVEEGYLEKVGAIGSHFITMTCISVVLFNVCCVLFQADLNK